MIIFLNDHDKITVGITPTNDQVSGLMTGTSGVFDFIQTIFVFIGIVIVIITLFKVIKAFAGAKFPDAVKFGLGGVVAAALCFNLMLPINLITGISGLLGNVFTSISDTATKSDTDTKKADTGGTTPTGAPAATTR